jgi:sirohydrochlorin ferrochelatase
LGGLGKNRAPLAKASASRSFASASIIRLDGSGSTDPDGDALRYRWSFTTRPADSALTDADIQDSTSALASFKADTSGTYAVRLVVRDGLASDSALLSGIVVKIVEDHDPVDDTTAPRWGDVEGADARQSAFGGPSFGGGPALGGFGKNRAPLAEASASRSLASASIIRLDGSGSTDPDGDALRYRWSFTTRPADSCAHRRRHSGQHVGAGVLQGRCLGHLRRAPRGAGRPHLRLRPALGHRREGCTRF